MDFFDAFVIDVCAICGSQVGEGVILAVGREFSMVAREARVRYKDIVILEAADCMDVLSEGKGEVREFFTSGYKLGHILDNYRD